MIKGNASDALQLLTNNQCILPLDDVTMNELHIKHSEASPMYKDLLIQGPTAFVNEVKFGSIDENGILQACLRTNGAAGVSG